YFLDGHGRAFVGQRSADASAAVGDRLVRVSHVERGHAYGEAADGHGGVCRERGGDTHLVGEVRDAMGADFEADFGVDRVVRVGRGAGQSIGTGVGAFVVVHDKFFPATWMWDD